MTSLISLNPLAAETLSVSSGSVNYISSVDRWVLDFVSGTQSYVHFTTAWPAHVTGTASATVSFLASAITTGTVRFLLAVEAISNGDAVNLLTTSSFDTVNSAGGSVNGTAGRMAQVTMALSNIDGAVARDLVRWRFGRDGDGSTGTDNAADTIRVLCLEIHDNG